MLSKWKEWETPTWKMPWLFVISFLICKNRFQILFLNFPCMNLFRFHCGFVLLKVQDGKEQWDELKVVHTLDDYRSQQELNRGPSFSTIAAFGPNGAVIHYRPSAETNRVIDNSSFLLIDSGGQYLGASSTCFSFFFFSFLLSDGMTDERGEFNLTM